MNSLRRAETAICEELVLDASAGIEMIARTVTGSQLAALIPAATTLWVPTVGATTATNAESTSPPERS